MTSLNSPTIAAVKSIKRWLGEAKPGEKYTVFINPAKEEHAKTVLSLVESILLGGHCTATKHSYSDGSGRFQYVLTRTEKPEAPEPADKPTPNPEHTGLPVAGYQPQPDSAVAIVNEHKMIEERILRRLDQYFAIDAFDKRWVAIARTHFEEAFMAANRAVFKSHRVTLPEDEQKG